MSFLSCGPTYGVGRGHCQPVPARSRLSGTGGWTEELRGRVARLHGVAGQEVPVEVEGAVHLFVGLDSLMVLRGPRTTSRETTVPVVW